MVDVNNQKKRRLPEWMSRTGSSSKEKQTEDDADEPSQPESGLETTTSEGFIVKEKDLELNKRSGRSHKNVSDNAVSCSTKSGLQKRPPKVDIKTICKAKKTASTCNMKDANKESGDQSSGGNEYELELTVDDLISIAREYVKTDEEEKRVGRGQQKSTSRPINPIPSSAFKSSSGGATDTGVSESTAVSCGSRIIPETKRKGSDIFELGCAATTSSRSGDAAQDMLDVFLGPLLKKSDPWGHKLEAVAADDVIPSYADSSKNTTPQTSMFLDPLIRKPDLRVWKTEMAAADGMHRACATSSRHAAAEADGRTEAVVLEKKKSSLKYKVTMLLD